MPRPPQYDDQILNAIHAFWAVKGYGPSFRDLVFLTDAKSPSVVRDSVKRLVERGDVEWDEGIARSVRIKRE